MSLQYVREEFVECPPCRVKPGSPVLCAECLETKLGITVAQHKPLLIYELSRDPSQFDDLIDWLRHPDHEGEFDLLYRGFDYHFETPREARQWALGFHLAWTMAVEDAFHSTRAIRLDGDPRNPRRSE